MAGAASVALGEIGVYPIGALSIAFHESLSAERIIGRAKSATTDWALAQGTLRIDGAPRDVRAQLRRGLAGGVLPEAVIVCPWTDQLSDFLDELLGFFGELDSDGTAELARVPYFLLASSGIYFEDLLAEARGRVKRSALSDKPFFLGALERRLFRASTYQAALRGGRGPEAEYFTVAGAAFAVLSRNGTPEDRDRICALMRGRGYDVAVEDRYLEGEFDKAIVNATVSAFSQARCLQGGRLRSLSCGEAAVPDERLRKVGEAFVAVAKAKGVYPPEVTFESTFARVVDRFVSKVSRHPPSSVQLLGDRLRDPRWKGERLLPTEEHIVRPMIYEASRFADQRSAEAFRTLERDILASYRGAAALRDNPFPLLERLARGEELDGLEKAAIQGRCRRALEEAYQAMLEIPPSAAEEFADRLSEPLLKILLGKKPGRCLVVGIHGLPGTGKTTLARILIRAASDLTPKARVVELSIDDFYFENAERIRRSLGWAVGAHDLSQAPLVGALKSAGPGDSIQVRRFDKKAREMRAVPETVRGPVDLIVFEGFGVGLRSEGYEALSKHVDLLLALRAPEPVCKEWRKQAGWADRQKAHAGDRSAFEREFEALWAGIRGRFGPVCAEAESRADFILDLGPSHRIDAVSRRT